MNGLNCQPGSASVPERMEIELLTSEVGATQKVAGLAAGAFLLVVSLVDPGLAGAFEVADDHPRGIARVAHLEQRIRSMALSGFDEVGQASVQVERDELLGCRLILGRFRAERQPCLLPVGSEVVDLELPQFLRAVTGLDGDGIEQWSIHPRDSEAFAAGRGGNQVWPFIWQQDPANVPTVEFWVGLADGHQRIVGQSTSLDAPLNEASGGLDVLADSPSAPAVPLDRGTERLEGLGGDVGQGDPLCRREDGIPPGLRIVDILGRDSLRLEGADPLFEVIIERSGGLLLETLGAGIHQACPTLVGILLPLDQDLLCGRLIASLGRTLDPRARVVGVLGVPISGRAAAVCSLEKCAHSAGHDCRSTNCKSTTVQYGTGGNLFTTERLYTSVQDWLFTTDLRGSPTRPVASLVVRTLAVRVFLKFEKAAEVRFFDKETRRGNLPKNFFLTVQEIFQPYYWPLPVNQCDGDAFLRNFLAWPKKNFSASFQAFETGLLRRRGARFRESSQVDRQACEPA